MRFRPQAGKSEEEEEEEGYDCYEEVHPVLLVLNTTANIQTWVQFQF